LRRSISLSLSFSAIVKDTSLLGRRSAFAHPLDDHLINSFQSRMFRLGGRAPGTRFRLEFGRDFGCAGGFLAHGPSLQRISSLGAKPRMSFGAGKPGTEAGKPDDSAYYAAVFGGLDRMTSAEWQNG
jgi:hypothetical protein